MRRRIFPLHEETPLQKAVLEDYLARQKALTKSASASPSRKRLEELDRPQLVYTGLYKDAAAHLWRIEKDAETGEVWLVRDDEAALEQEIVAELTAGARSQKRGG